MDVKQARVARLHDLLKLYGGRKVELAAALRKAPSQVSQWFSGVRQISEDTAREIEATLKLEPGWMDRANHNYPLQNSIGLTASESPAALKWPFDRIDQRLVLQLAPHHVADLEAAMLAVAGQLRLHIRRRS